MNTAPLTGVPRAVPVTLVTVEAGGGVAEVTEPLGCESADKQVLQVSGVPAPLELPPGGLPAPYPSVSPPPRWQTAAMQCSWGARRAGGHGGHGWTSGHAACTPLCSSPSGPRCCRSTSSSVTPPWSRCGAGACLVPPRGEMVPAPNRCHQPPPWRGPGGSWKQEEVLSPTALVLHVPAPLSPKALGTHPCRAEPPGAHATSSCHTPRHAPCPTEPCRAGDGHIPLSPVLTGRRMSPGRRLSGGRGVAGPSTSARQCGSWRTSWRTHGTVAVTSPTCLAPSGSWMSPTWWLAGHVCRTPVWRRWRGTPWWSAGSPASPLWR